MAIADRISAMYDHVEDIYDTMALDGDTTSNKNIVNINTEIKREYKDFLKNGVDTLWNNWEKVSGEGTELSLNNTMEARMETKLKGNTQQAILPSGYTQVDYIQNSGTQFIDTGFKPNQNTSFEIKILIPQDSALTTRFFETRNFTYSNGSFGLLNFRDENNQFQFRYNTSFPKTNYHLNTGTIYKIRTNKNLVYIDDELAITANNSNFQVNYNLALFGFANATNNVADSSVYKLYMFKLYDNNNLIRDFVPCKRNNDNAVGLYDLVSNTFYGNSGTGTFTYGNIAPTPDTPIPIQVVSGDNSIKVEGKNLFDISSCPILEYAFYDGNGNSVSWAGTCGIREYIKLEENSTYTIKYNGNANFLICFYDKNKTYLSQLTKASGGNFTMPSTAQYIRFGINIVIANVEWCQIELGTTSTTYTPYVSQTYPISLGNIELCKIGTYQDYIRKSTGKNLLNLDRTLGQPSDTTASSTTKRKFNYNEVIKGISGTNYYYPSNVSSYNIQNGNVSMTTGGTSSYGLGFPIKTEANTTYTMSFNMSSTNARVQVMYYASDGTFIDYESKSASFTFTTPSNCDFVLINFTGTQTNTTYTFTNCQLEKGNQATPYEPYGKVWYLHKEIGKVVLDGSENWSLSSASPQRFIYNFGDGYSDAAKLLILSNYFKGIKFDDRDNVNYPSIYLENGYIGCNKTGIDTVVNFTTWLSNNNTTVYYVLATPTNTEITDSTLLGQLNNLYNANSYEETTNVSQVNDDLESILNVTALEDIS